MNKKSKYYPSTFIFIFLLQWWWLGVSFETIKSFNSTLITTSLFHVVYFLFKITNKWQTRSSFRCIIIFHALQFSPSNKICNLTTYFPRSYYLCYKDKMIMQGLQYKCPQPMHTIETFLKWFVVILLTVFCAEYMSMFRLLMIAYSRISTVKGFPNIYLYSYL